MPALVSALAAAVVAGLSACGGGSSATGPEAGPPHRVSLAVDPAGDLSLEVGRSRTVTVSSSGDSLPGGLDLLTASSADPRVAAVEADSAPGPSPESRSFSVRALGPGSTSLTFRHAATGALVSVRVVVTALLPLDRPNPARFYTKLGGEADFWGRSDGGVRDAVARWSDVVFISGTLDATRAIAAELRSRAAPGRGPILLRYWNMWVAYNPGGEARYTESMYVYRNWPSTDAPARGWRIVNATQGHCGGLALVDVSSPALQAEMARVVQGFLADFDGVYFDISSWDVYERAHRLGDIAMSDGLTCLRAPFTSASGFLHAFLPASPEHVARYHEQLQVVIDPAGSGEKLHFCNALPRSSTRADPAFEERYLSTFDGCQMDPAFSNEAGVRWTRADWLFQVETVRRFASRGRYFMVKIPWTPLPEPLRTDVLEHGFASYLLAADGRYALFMPAYNFTAWESEPLVSAPLGRAIGEMRPAAGAASGSWVWTRDFERGIVVVNADGAPRAVTLPPGTFRDARTGVASSGSLTLPGTSGRILLVTGS